MKVQDTYTYERTIEFPGLIARIYRPVLTDEERAKRMARIHKAAANLLIKKGV